jgi:glycerophosphoryl diester phosphodiesterase
MRVGPLLYAHRGARLEHPENSLEAFSAALAAGADALEIDVHMTRDGHPVVAHDGDGRRTAGVAREIRNCTLVEIKHWDLGATVRMPTLEETLSAFPDALLNVDVKQTRPDMVPALIALIARHRAQARVLLTSFLSATTQRIRTLGYQGPTGLGRAEALRAVFAPGPVLARWPLAGGRLQIPVRSGPLRLDRALLVSKMHAHGIAVDYWVVDDAVEAERLLELGADGIVCDDPRRMAELYARSPHTAGWRARHAQRR